METSMDFLRLMRIIRHVKSYYLELLLFSALSIELSMMIADIKSRGKGIASEALSLFKDYCLNVLCKSYPFEVSIKEFVAKIQSDNIPSRRLFEKAGFTIYKEVPVFNETEYRLIL